MKAGNIILGTFVLAGVGFGVYMVITTLKRKKKEKIKVEDPDMMEVDDTITTTSGGGGKGDIPISTTEAIQTVSEKDLYPNYTPVEDICQQALDATGHSAKAIRSAMIVQPHWYLMSLDAETRRSILDCPQLCVNPLIC